MPKSANGHVSESTELLGPASWINLARSLIVPHGVQHASNRAVQLSKNLDSGAVVQIGALFLIVDGFIVPQVDILRTRQTGPTPA